MMPSHEPLNDVYDRDLEQRVRLFLLGRGHAALSLVTVDVSNGVVALRGQMPSFHMRQLAVECTKHVAGVRQMLDELQVETHLDGVGESKCEVSRLTSHLREQTVMPGGYSSYES